MRKRPFTLWNSKIIGKVFKGRDRHPHLPNCSRYMYNNVHPTAVPNVSVYRRVVPTGTSLGVVADVSRITHSYFATLRHFNYPYCVVSSYSRPASGSFALSDGCLNRIKRGTWRECCLTPITPLIDPPSKPMFTVGFLRSICDCNCYWNREYGTHRHHNILKNSHSQTNINIIQNVCNM